MVRFAYNNAMFVSVQDISMSSGIPHTLVGDFHPDVCFISQDTLFSARPVCTMHDIC